jgi:hypothetical protein
MTHVNRLYDTVVWRCNLYRSHVWLLGTTRVMSYTFLTRYATFLARYDRLLTRNVTLLARYDAILARYATFLTRYASCTLFWCSSTHWGLYYSSKLEVHGKILLTKRCVTSSIHCEISRR